MTTLEEFIDDSLYKVPIEPIRLDPPVPLDSLPTPALVLDLNVFERNLDKMQQHMQKHGMGLRAHTKMHKSPIIANKQIEKGCAWSLCSHRQRSGGDARRRRAEYSDHFAGSYSR